MEEIQIGEYVRTNDGKIGKLIRIERDDIDISLKWYVFDDRKNERYINKPYIVKHSKNIIDLIEVGDIVNGEKVIEIFNSYFLNLGELPYVITQNNKYEEQDIETILTHEQYENDCYRIGE